MRKTFNERGIAMPIVLIALVLTSIFGYSLLFMINNQSKFNSVDKQMKLALEYAEAGYNKYLWHLNDDVNFYSVDPDGDAFKDANKEEQVIAKKLLKGEVIKFQEGYYQVVGEKPSDKDRFVNIKSTGWTKENPKIKKTIEAKVRKKQFVHHVYVSNNDGDDIWWTDGEESHGPLHTNKDISIDKTPKFYDTVTYGNELIRGTSRVIERNFWGRPTKYSTYEPYYYFDKKETETTKTKGAYTKNPPHVEKVSELKFPKDNIELIKWAKLDGNVISGKVGEVLIGRTCIFLMGDKIKIRNKNESKSREIKLSDIKNKVLYVKKEKSYNKDGLGVEKFDLEAGNIFISGTLKGQLTIASEQNIYITAGDPTKWYEDDDINKRTPNIDIINYGGLNYSTTSFYGNKNKTGEAMSSYDNEKKIYTRYSFGMDNSNKSGKDMLGLVANDNIYILHYGWPRYMKSSENSKFNQPYWNYEWSNGNKGHWTKGYRGNLIFQNEVNKDNYDVAPNDITIHAALFAINGGFGYEESSSGSKKGEIVLWGNITQNNRKAVGTTGGIGYKKRYAHDPRMFYDYPPHILEPSNLGWEIHEWKETNDHLTQNP